MPPAARAAEIALEPAFEPVIGLEVHAQLLSATKLFCGCPTEFGAPPNTNICPVCIGLPGALPVTNRRAIELAARAALALGCTVRHESRFARKNYFYPDLPKGYQISQYELPLSEHGALAIEADGVARRVGIQRIHVEEDAGKNVHAAGRNVSLVDFNRSGVPLIEIVSEPDLGSAAEASEYLRALRGILMYIEVCDGNLEEGSFRCDANVSVRPTGSSEFGTRTELKNLNSFKFVQKAIDFEIRRQISTLSAGGRVVLETRQWDDAAGKTLAMRSKEQAHDYRYFPDPDLPPLRVDAAFVAKVKSELPELPSVRRERYVRDLSLPPYDASVLTSHKGIADFFEAVVRAGAPPKRASNWTMTEVLRVSRTDGLRAKIPVRPDALARLIARIEEGAISGAAAKEIFVDLQKGVDALAVDRIIADRGLAQVSDVGAIEAATRAVVGGNPREAEAYRGGKDKLLGFFVGQVMRKMGGRASPAVVNEVVKRLLDQTKS